MIYLNVIIRNPSRENWVKYDKVQLAGNANKLLSDAASACKQCWHWINRGRVQLQPEQVMRRTVSKIFEGVVGGRIIENILKDYLNAF